MSALFEQQLKASGVAQVVVRLKLTAAAAATQSLAGHFRLAETSQQTALAAAANMRAGGGTRPLSRPAPKAMRMFPNLGIMLGTVNREGLTALTNDTEHVAEVRSAPVFCLIRPRETSAAAASPDTQVTWGITALGIDQAWKQGLTGKGVIVGHLDTGVDGTHPIFTNNAIADWAYFDDFGELDTTKPNAFDTDRHGTHTAGTIVGRPFTNGGTTYHVGLAFEAQLVSAAVIEGGDTVARVLAGMDWVLGKGARILNMSLGIPGYTDDWEFLTGIFRQRNVLPVFAVGNEGPGTSRSPGNYSDALSVGAVDRNSLIAEFSSSQLFARTTDPIVPDVLGPGVDVTSAIPGKQFMSMNGTSMATPHIAGLAALLMQARPTATVSDIEKAIFASCRPPTGMIVERGNRGIPNIIRALDALSS